MGISFNSVDVKEATTGQMARHASRFSSLSLADYHDYTRITLELQQIREGSHLGFYKLQHARPPMGSYFINRKHFPTTLQFAIIAALFLMDYLPTIIQYVRASLDSFIYLIGAHATARCKNILTLQLATASLVSPQESFCLPVINASRHSLLV
jgi:hypothetical protein